MSKSLIFLQNILSNWSIVLLNIVIVFFTFPIAFNKLSYELFGIFVMFSSFVQLTGILDLGLKNYLQKNTSIFHRDRNFENIQLAFISALNTLWKIILFFILLLIVFYFLSSSIFNYTLENEAILKYVIFFGLINAFITLIKEFIAAIFYGVEKIYILNLFTSICLLLKIPLFYFFQEDLVDFQGLVRNLFLLHFLEVLFAFIYIFKYFYKQGVRLNFDSNFFNSNYKFKNKNQFMILNYVSFFSTNSHKFIIATFVNISAVGVYEIVSKPFYLIKNIIGLFFSIYQSMLIDLGADAKILVNSFFLLCLNMAIIMFVFSGLLLEPFMIFWLGDPQISEIIFWAHFMILISAISLVNGALFRFYIMNDQVSFIIKIETISGIINALISIVGTRFYGYEFVIIGSFVQFTISLIAMIYLSKSENLLTLRKGIILIYMITLFSCLYFIYIKLNLVLITIGIVFCLLFLKQLKEVLKGLN